MYTNRGFLRRNYGQKPIRPQPSHELRLPKINHYSPPQYKPSYYNQSPSNSKNYKYIDTYLSSSNKYLANIFTSEKLGGSLEYSNSQKVIPTYNYSVSPKAERPRNTTNPVIGYSIFEIVSSGYSNTPRSGYGNPIGMGFLITKSLAITVNTVIPDEGVASRAYARFSDNIYEILPFDAQSFFYTNRDLNFTLIGFSLPTDSKKTRAPIEFREDFVLKEGDFITYINSNNSGRNINTIDREMFNYTAGSYILPGMPLFTLDWKLQGIHHTCTASYRFNQATRIDAIIKCILSVRSVSTHPDLDLLLTEHSPKERKIDTEHSQGRYLYWIEWYNRNIYRYDIPLERWNKLKISNISEFLDGEQSEWSFNWGCRIVYVGNKVYIVGGVGHELSSTKADFYEFQTDSREIYRRKDMNERREGPAVVEVRGAIFVIGGKYSYNSCEKYSIKDNTWVAVAQMNYGRYEPVAVVAQNQTAIYVVGGFPQEMVGKSIEKYEISRDIWQNVNIIFPYPVIHPGIFPIDSNRFAIFGGRYCKAVTILEISDEIFEQSYNNSAPEQLKMHEIENLPDQIETVYPIVHYKEDNKVYIMKSQEGSSPQVFFYNINNFYKSTDLQSSRRNLKLPSLFSKPSELNSSIEL